MNIDNLQLLREHEAGMTYLQLGEKYGISKDAVKDRIRRVREKQPIQDRAAFRGIAASSMPQYNQPLRAEDEAALLLFDTEFPYHNADFLNRCLDLAYTWKVNTCILGGDAAHFDTFSHWEANWTKPTVPGDNLTPETAQILRETIAKLPEQERAELAKILDTIPVEIEGNDELAELRRNLETLGGMFSKVFFALGNHDARFLHALNSPLLPRKLLDFIGGCPEHKWEISCYYYAFLDCGGRTFRIEHPKSAAANTAVRLSDKYEMDVIVGHSHIQSFCWSTSGNHYAIQAGCIVDESRLAYAAQRSTNSPAHSLGAVLVRDGYPYVLTKYTQWNRMKQMA